MKVGSKIKILRELKGISSKEMAHRLDMSLTGYAKIEREEVDVNTERLCQIADLLDTKPENILALNERFCQSNHDNANHNQIGNFNNYYPEKLQQLYEDKIRLLEEKVAYLEQELKRVRG